MELLTCDWRGCLVCRRNDKLIGRKWTLVAKIQLQKQRLQKKFGCEIRQRNSAATIRDKNNDCSIKRQKQKKE